MFAAPGQGSGLRPPCHGRKTSPHGRRIDRGGRADRGVLVAAGRRCGGGPPGARFALLRLGWIASDAAIERLRRLTSMTHIVFGSDFPFTPAAGIEADAALSAKAERAVAVLAFRIPLGRMRSGSGPEVTWHTGRHVVLNEEGARSSRKAGPIRFPRRLRQRWPGRAPQQGKRMRATRSESMRRRVRPWVHPAT